LKLKETGWRDLDQMTSVTKENIIGFLFAPASRWWNSDA
jgi:hypothetical protein